MLNGNAELSKNIDISASRLFNSPATVTESQFNKKLFCLCAMLFDTDHVAEFHGVEEDTR